MAEITILVERIVWRTRGKLWDYLFLLSPESGVSSWYKFIKLLTSDEDSENRFGKMVDANGARCFFAFSQFTDPEFTDRVNRPILHDFILIIEEHECKSLPENWHEQAYQQIKGIYQHVYGLSQESLALESNKVEAYLRQYVHHHLSKVVIKTQPAHGPERPIRSVELSLDQIQTVAGIPVLVKPEESFSANNMLQRRVPTWLFISAVAIMCLLSYMLGSLYGIPEYFR